MKKILTGATVGVLTFLGAGLALAEDGAGAIPTPQVNAGVIQQTNQKELELRREAAKREMELKRETAKKEIEVRRETAKNAIKTMRASTTAEIKIRREALKDEAEAKREEMKKANEARREELKKELEKKREEIKQEAEKNREEIKNKIEAERAKLKNEKEKQRADAVKNYYDKSVSILNERIDKLTKSADEISARIASFEAKGANLSESKNLLQVARAKISDAQKKVDELSAAAVQAVASTTAKTAGENMKVLRKGADDSIFAAHKSLTDVINSVKMGLNKNNQLVPGVNPPVQPTTTPSGIAQ